MEFEEFVMYCKNCQSEVFNVSFDGKGLSKKVCSKCGSEERAWERIVFEYEEEENLEKLVASDDGIDG